MKSVPLSRAIRKKHPLREIKSSSCQPAPYLMLFLATACLITRDVITAQGFGMTEAENKVPAFLSHISDNLQLLSAYIISVGLT